MKVTFVELRQKTSEIRRALERNEPVTLLYRGKVRGIIQPAGKRTTTRSRKVEDHPAFGMWADREDMKDVGAYVRKLRRGRYRDL